jgi:hypothetical protein
MERKRITCPETAHLEEVDLDRTPLGIVIAGCSRFSPRGAVDCPRDCAARLDRRVRRDRDDHSERVLVVSSGDDGRTAEIARMLAHDLTTDGLIVEVADLDRGAAPPPSDYEAVVIVSPVRFRRFARSAIAYVEAHRGELSAMPGFWISVSPSAGASSRSLDRMFRRTGWLPTRSVTFTRPGWLARRIGDPAALAESPRIHDLAIAIADDLPVIESAI